MQSRLALFCRLFLLLASACADEEGTAQFTTWGEEYVEHQIPADATGQRGFVDGWTLKFDKFLVAFHAITVADDDGKVAAVASGSQLVDNVVPGRKVLASFPDLKAQHWPRVSYQIKPALPDSVVVSGTAADRELMVQNGYAIYVSGTASKPGADGPPIVKTFHWGFRTATQYHGCRQPAESGRELEGIVITGGGTDTSELTTHGDHFFYDRLLASPDPAVPTSLRFEEKAAADANHDGEVTLEELNAVPLDLTRYNPSSLEASSLGAFVSALARTVGHFRGEGECTVSELR